MRQRKKEFSKVVTASVVATFSLLAAGFVIFVCYEMHRQNDLSPVSFIGVSLVGLLVLVLKGYLKRAEAKDLADLEWEKTKQLTLFREKHPEHFTQGTITLPDDTTDDYTGGVG